MCGLFPFPASLRRLALLLFTLSLPCFSSSLRRLVVTGWCQVRSLPENLSPVGGHQNPIVIFWCCSYFNHASSHATEQASTSEVITLHSPGAPHYCDRFLNDAAHAVVLVDHPYICAQLLRGWLAALQSPPHCCTVFRSPIVTAPDRAVLITKSTDPPMFPFLIHQRQL